MLVVGAGPVGQTAALLLARYGIAVTVLEAGRSREPAGSRAISRKPRTATPGSASGTVTLGMIVAQKLRKNRKIIRTTSTTVISNVNCTSSTAARMVVVRSLMSLILIVGGIAAISLGNSALIRSTVSMRRSRWRTGFATVSLRHSSRVIWVGR